jgi:hypothetical protein
VRQTQPSGRQTQPERTRLSWRRTVLTGTVVGLLLARLAVPGRLSAAGVTVLALAVLGWLALLVLAQHRITRLAVDRPAAVRRAPFAAGVILLGYAVLGALLVILHTG